MTVSIHAQDNLFEYFRVRVEEARAASATPLTDEGALYLAQLLSERARVDHTAHTETTLVELHARACASPPAEQAATWRELGDRSLYALGFFPEHVEGRLVSRSYYEGMGSSAYARVDDVLKRWFRDAFGPVFSELAHRFRVCVDLVAHVRDAHDQSDELTRLYDQWLETGDEEVAAKLRRRGLVLPRRAVLDV